MKRIMRIAMICNISISLCACGQSASSGENDRMEQAQYDGVISQTITDDTDRDEMESAETGSMTEERSMTEQTGGNGAEAAWRNDPELEEWKQVYLDYLDTLKGADSLVYSLIYVDDDDIPELVADTGFNYGITLDGGCQFVLTFHDHVLDEWKPLRSRFTYIERGNAICKIYSGAGDNERFHSDSVYTIQDGKWVYAGGGYYTERVEMSRLSLLIGKLLGGYYPDASKRLIYEYCWDDAGTEEYVSEEEYAARLNAIYPEWQGLYPQKYYCLDDICSIIRTGDVISAGHSNE